MRKLFQALVSLSFSAVLLVPLEVLALESNVDYKFVTTEIQSGDTYWKLCNRLFISRELPIFMLDKADPTNACVNTVLLWSHNITLDEYSNLERMSQRVFEPRIGDLVKLPVIVAGTEEMSEVQTEDIEVVVAPDLYIDEVLEQKVVVDVSEDVATPKTATTPVATTFAKKVEDSTIVKSKDESKPLPMVFIIMGGLLIIGLFLVRYLLKTRGNREDM